MSVYQEVTDRIIKELETGVIPWVKPWRADSSADKNLISKENYKGINRLLLGMSSMSNGFNSPVWATYQQWQSKGVQVKKGEKGTQIVFFKPVKTETVNDQGETETGGYNVLKSYFVFNASQTDIEVIPSAETDTTPFNPIPECEARIVKTGAIINHGGDSAFYHRESDKIQLPNKNTFLSEAHYYATAFHELTHWAGAAHRLDRVKGKRFGDPAYAFEELVAEIGAAYLCADHKIQGELCHAAYIESWLKALRDDNRAIFKAAALAQKASEYIMQLDNTLALAA